jgi:protein involved in polysaccharide export with SLBB domain
MPLAGNLRVEGLTIPQLERLLTERLGPFVDRPNVVVNPKEINSLRIFIVGSIRRPDVSIGPVRPAFILRGGNTLLEALSDVEFLPDADLAASYVSRGQVIIPVDLKALLKDGDLRQNLLLEPGDRVVVPGPLKEVTVLGEVRQPDRYRVNLDTTLMDALSIARGVNPQTADLYMAYVARRKQVLPINLKRLLTMGDLSQNLVMEDGDVVYVPDSRDNRFFVLGEVFRPGVVNYTEPMDVVEAVAQAGGFLITAQRSQVVVVRGDVRSPQLYQVNALGMIEGRFGERFTLQRGDIVYVPRTPIADWNVFITQLLPTIQAVELIDLIRSRN